MEVHSNLDIANKSVRPFFFNISNNSLSNVICLVNPQNGSWVLFTKYIAKFTILRFVISRFECTSRSTNCITLLHPLKRQQPLTSYKTLAPQTVPLCLQWISVICEGIRSGRELTLISQLQGALTVVPLMGWKKLSLSPISSSSKEPHY